MRLLLPLPVVQVQDAQLPTIVALLITQDEVVHESSG
jgi:hypothetical protein